MRLDRTKTWCRALLCIFQNSQKKNFSLSKSNSKTQGNNIKGRSAWRYWYLTLKSNALVEKSWFYLEMNLLGQIDLKNTHTYVGVELCQNDISMDLGNVRIMEKPETPLLSQFPRKLKFKLFHSEETLANFPAVFFSFFMEHKWISKYRLLLLLLSITETLKSHISIPFQDFKNCWFITATYSFSITFEQTLQIMMHTKVASILPIHSPITN